MRITEAVRLRVQDIDFEYKQITVRSGKGNKDRVTTFSSSLGISKRVSAHTCTTSFATHLLQRGTDIRTIQALLRHSDLETSIVYTHVLNQGGHGVTSPLDDLGL